MSDYVKVYETPPDNPCSLSESHWLEELLNTNSIPFRTEQASAWTGWSKAPDYKERREYYVPDTCACYAKTLIREYTEGETIRWDEGEFFPEGVENQLPKVTCPHCGKEYDMDYPKCPFCS